MLLIPNNQLVLASNNQGKLAELHAMFEDAQLNVSLMTQGSLDIADAEETGLSFVENAILKARHAAKMSGKAALADDSGLCVPLLGGSPGIYSARYAGKHGDDAANNALLLENLLPFRRHNQPIHAMFVCVLALVTHEHDPLPVVCHGIWHGHILEQLTGSHGFGYDPLFWIPSLGKSSAELSAAQKNVISHRAQALKQLIALLKMRPDDMRS